MSSPLIPSPISYGDIPAGGSYALMVVAARAPSNTIDKQYPAGYFWLSSRDMYYLNAQNVRVYGDGSIYYQGGNSSGVPNWTIFSDGSSIVSILETANQITATNVAGTVTLSIPAVFIAPGSIASTTTIAAGTTITAGTSVTAGTTVTATLGDITATNGDLVLGTSGNKLVIPAATAASDSIGTSAALDGASPSQLVVSTTAVTAASKIFLTYATQGGTQGSLTVGTIVDGVSFQILSSANGDTSTVNYLIIN